MLKIENRDKIKGLHIEDWFIHSIEEAHNWELITKVNYPVYDITLKHMLYNETKKVYLLREPIDENGLLWYKLRCVNDEGREQIQYISFGALKNITNLLDSIKQIGQLR